MAEAAVADESESPLTTKKAKAADLVAGTIAAGTAHIETMEKLIEQLKALSDPSIAEAELEAVRFDAEKRVASANSKAAKAKAAKQQMGEQLAEAEAVADEAVSAITELEAKVNEQSQKHKLQIEELLSTHATELNRLSDELASSEKDNATLIADLNQANSDLAMLRNERDEAVRRREETEAHKLTLDGRIEALRQELADSSATATAQTTRADQLERDLARVQADLETASIERSASQKEAAQASSDAAASAARLAQVEQDSDRRFDDLKVGYEARLQDLRDQLAKLQDLQRTAKDSTDTVVG